MIHTLRFWPLMMLVALWALPAAAFQLVPIQATFQPSGPEAVQSFRVENTSEEPVAVEISVSRRGMNEDGSDELVPDEESFVVVPTQLVLKPNQVQTVRVQWVGDTAPNSELAFRLVAEQVPIDTSGKPVEGGRLRMLVRYLASLYVAPAGVKPELAIESVAAATAEDGSPRLAVVVANRGSAHGILRDPRLIITSRSGAKAEVVAAELDSQNVLARARRRFLVAVPAGVGDDALEARLVLP